MYKIGHMAPYVVLFILAVLPLAAQEDGPAFFEKNVRPLLAAQCLGCHSAASQPIMGGLRLDSREQALKGGGRGPSIVPGKPVESLLLQAVRHTAGPLKMPPGPKMKDADLAVNAFSPRPAPRSHRAPVINTGDPVALLCEQPVPKAPRSLPGIPHRLPVRFAVDVEQERMLPGIWDKNGK